MIRIADILQSVFPYGFEQIPLFFYFFVTGLLLLGLIVRFRADIDKIFWQPAFDLSFLNLAVFLFILLGSFAVGFLVLMVLENMAELEIFSVIFIATLVLQILLAVSTLLYMKIKLGKKMKQSLLPARNLYLQEVIRGFCYYLKIYPVLLLVIVVNGIILSYFGFSQANPGSLFFMQLADTPPRVLGLFVLVVVVAPVAEELIFRGFFYQVLRRKLYPALAAGVCGLVFALFHLEILFIPVFFILGYYLSRVFEKSGTLLAPATFHAVHNLISLVFYWLLF